METRIRQFGASCYAYPQTTNHKLKGTSSRRFKWRIELPIEVGAKANRFFLQCALELWSLGDPRCGGQEVAKEGYVNQ